MNKKNTNQQNYSAQNGYPQQSVQFSENGVPFPAAGYGEVKKSSKSMYIILAIVVVVIVALAVTLLVVLKERNESMMMPEQPEMVVKEDNTVWLNNQQIPFDVINKDAKLYLPVEELSDFLGYECTVDGETVTIKAFMETITIMNGRKDITKTDNVTGASEYPSILEGLIKYNNKYYVYSRDLTTIFRNTTVNYDSARNIVDIRIGEGGQSGPGGPGGPGGPPPGGQSMPQQGAPAQPAPSGQSAPPSAPAQPAPSGQSAPPSAPAQK